MNERDQVLVAIMNNQRDMKIARDRHWYRIPVQSLEKYLKNWQPDWLAFYQTKVFGDEAYAIHYYARVNDINVVDRAHLFPEEAANAKSEKRYYKLELSPLERLSQPILSQRYRRITFIQTTLERLQNATEISDLPLTR